MHKVRKLWMETREKKQAKTDQTKQSNEHSKKELFHSFTFDPFSEKPHHILVVGLLKQLNFSFLLMMVHGIS